ncbi:hypothetical protein BT96DRAFT_1023993 [Gymnopus androsaceus JB14]|uniref:Uncharacterized protein n=1 Tax=Gymnopus androsaceus JB14 TaxID=1447944 RepID=A0A6A4H1K4_9AGAR|nr:hypothetical protein BT96DRAFT_1023993 [Gymnopus androsaceus JB14]
MDSSLNLNTLASSLPNPYQSAEKDLLNNFKAAALSITTLYRSSRHASKRAYNAGYASACNDLLLMIQQGVSAEGMQSHNHPDSSDPSSGMTIGKVMDWIEARMEAIKSREEEEDEEEEKERESANPSSSSKSSKPPIPQVSTQPAPNHVTSQSQPSSPSPPPTTLRRPNNNNSSSSSSNKSSRMQAQSKGDSSLPLQHPLVAQPTSPSFSFAEPDLPSTMLMTPPLSVSTVSPFPDTVSAVAAGAKRRHAVMMMLDPTSSPSTVGSSTSTPSGSPALHGHGHHSTTSRRRTRSTRNNVQNQNQNLGLGLTASEAMMDVEEDGRERKRVARR